MNVLDVFSGGGLFEGVGRVKLLVALCKFLSAQVCDGFAAFPFMHMLLAFILCSRSHLVLISSKKHGLICVGALAPVLVQKLDP